MTRLRTLTLLLGLTLALMAPACNQEPHKPIPSPHGITDNVNWLGYLLYAHQYPNVPEPLFHVETTVEIGLSQLTNHAILWRSTVKPPPAPLTQTTCPGLVAVYKTWNGPKLASYPWLLPLQPRAVQGLQLCLKDDGMVVWRRDTATTMPSNPTPLGLLGSGQPSATADGIPQLLPWWSYRMDAINTQQTEGPLAWVVETPTP